MSLRKLRNTSEVKQNKGLSIFDDKKKSVFHDCWKHNAVFALKVAIELGNKTYL